MGISKNEEPLFEPYKALFNVGDSLKLKTGNDFRRIHNEWMRLIEEEGIPVDWCPPKDYLENLSRNTFSVERSMFFHGGVPLYILSYEHDGKECKIRLCESFLTQGS